MLALGSVLAGAGVLFAGLLALLVRNPRAPRWAQLEVVALLTAVPVTGMIGFGSGYLLYGGAKLLRGEGDVRELAVLAAVLIVVALFWRILRIRGRLHGYAEANAGNPSTVIAIPGALLAPRTDEPPESPSPAKPPRRPTRKAA
jgi:hypothetical protein